MQRPDAYTAADKLTKPVWLVILGVGGAAGPGARHHRRRDRGGRRGRLSRRRAAQDPGNPGQVALVRVRFLVAAAIAAVAVSARPRARSRRPTRCPGRRTSTTSSGRSGATCPACGCTRLKPRGEASLSPATAAQADEAWAEVLALSPDADSPGMKDQFICHWELAELGQPGKVSWNLEPWRTEVSDEDDGVGALQPRRHRRTVLSAAPQPRERGRARRPHAAQAGGDRGRRRRAAAGGGRTRGVRGMRIADDGRDGQVIPDGRVCHRVGRGIPVRQTSFGDQGRGGSAGGSGGRRRDRHGDRRRIGP